MNNKEISNHNIVVAELVDKFTRKTKDDETYYILEVSTRKAITEMVLELKKETNSFSLNGREKLFVFSNQGRGNKYAYTLEKGCIYAFWIVKSINPETKEDYFHVKDWRKLSSDKRSVERTLRLVLNRKEEETEEEIMTNRELLTDLRKRMQEGKISLKVSAVHNDDNAPIEIDTDLKDNESNFRINLQKDQD